MASNIIQGNPQVSTSLGISRTGGEKKKDGKPGDHHNTFSIMKFVRGDPNFEAFW